MLFASPDDSAAGDVIGRHLNRNFIAGENSNEIHPEFSGNMRQNNMSVSDIHLEHRIGQGFNHCSFQFDYIVFSQSFLSSTQFLKA